MMNLRVKPVSAADSPRIIRRFILPRFGCGAPGPLHTVAVDPAGNIYYSDEINHSVVSLTGSGSPRWQKTQRGTAGGEFWYPRGISTGCLLLRGETVCCLAVADAWNRRVQFLDLEGNFLAIWTHGGEIPFSEVADVRFVEMSADSKDSGAINGCWYVLDRGNHRLCRFGIDGVILDQIGRGFPQSMEKRWAAPELFFSKGSDLPENVSRVTPFDFTFYPNRILGCTVDSLHIYEENSRRLKLVAPPHLLPVCSEADGNLEWIAADRLSLLAWDRAGNRLLRRLNPGGEYDQAGISGDPISSNLPSTEFWTQTADGIEMWKWDIPAACPHQARMNLPPWVIQSAEEEISRVDPTEVRNSVQVYLAEVGQELQLAGSIAATKEKEFVPQSVEIMLERVYWFKFRSSSAIQRLREELHHWCLSQLLRSLPGASREGFAERAMSVEKLRCDLREQMQLGLMDLQKHIEVLASRLSLPPAPGIESTQRDAWVNAAALSKQTLEFAQDLIAGLAEVLLP